MTDAQMRFLTKLLGDMIALVPPADTAYAGVLAVALAGEIDALVAEGRPHGPDAPGRAARERVQAERRLAVAEAAAAASLTQRFEAAETASLTLN
jgi:hypothetical protein